MKLIVSGCLLAAASVVLAGCRSEETARPVNPQVVQARVVESRQAETPSLVRTTGTVHARESAVLSAQVMGRVTQVLVHEGDAVRAGQTLVTLDDATLTASVDQASAAAKAAESQEAAAKTNADLASSTLARYKQLQAQKSVSPQEMDEVERRAQAAAAQVQALQAASQAAEAQATGARAMLSYAHIRAPFAGYVTARMADPGTMAAPGVPLLQIDSTGAPQLQTMVDESQISAVHKGMKLPVSVDGSGLSDLQGTVNEIVPAADPSSHSFLIKIDLPTSRQLRVGMYGTASFSTGSHQAILAPRTAVVQRGSLECAYVLDAGGVAQLRYITLGPSQGAQVEVLSGVSAGEKLVDQPGDRDFAGKRVEVRP